MGARLRVSHARRSSTSARGDGGSIACEAGVYRNSSHELLSLPKTNMKSKGSVNVTGLKFENRTRTRSRTRSPIWSSLFTRWRYEVWREIRGKQPREPTKKFKKMQYYNNYRESHIRLAWFLGSFFIPVESEFEDVGFCGGRKTGEPGGKNWEQGENQQQTQHTRHRTRIKVAWGERSDRCAIPRSKATLVHSENLSCTNSYTKTSLFWDVNRKFQSNTKDESKNPRQFPLAIWHWNLFQGLLWLG